LLCRTWGLELTSAHSSWAGALAYSDATSGTVTILQLLHLLATHFGGLSSDQPLQLLLFAVGMAVRNRANCPRGALRTPLKKTQDVELCLVSSEKRV